MLNMSRYQLFRAGMTPLHEAVGSDAAQPEMIRTLVDVIVKANNWSLVDAVDKHGNTALHVAARRARPDILPELAALNARAKNRDGETPFHVAARAGLPHNVETMLTVFNRPEKVLFDDPFAFSTFSDAQNLKNDHEHNLLDQT
jgi:ankyrin repeat protein